MQERLTIINQYTQQLKTSGYSWARAREIIVCGLLGLERKRERRRRNGEKFHRKAASTLAGRYRKKLTGKTDWYREKKREPEERKLLQKEWREKEKTKVLESEGQEIQTEGKGENDPGEKEMEGESSQQDLKDKERGSGERERKPRVRKEEKKRKQQSSVKAVISVPYTPNSELARRLKENEKMMEKMTGLKIKIEEKIGIQLEKVLTKSNQGKILDLLTKGVIDR